jgi:aldose 1-epimerase
MSDVRKIPFGNDDQGRAVDLYILDNGTIELHAMTFGCVITSLRVPDRRGAHDDVVLGHESLEPYLTNPPYIGAVVGRYANRIAGGKFTLDGEVHQLATNNGPNHLHGGPRGFHRQLWDAEPVETGDTVGVTFNRISPAGEEGYPGTLHVSVAYRVTGDTVDVQYEATTDTPTVINLTQHSYFNLGGRGRGDVLDHELTVAADTYTPVDSTLIPTGMLVPVKGTAFDLQSPTVIGPRLKQPDEQLRIGNGFDHNFVLAGTSGSVRRAATLRDPVSGRRLDLSTTQPGVQVYTGQSLDGRITGAYGRRFTPHSGMCLETQHYPDSPNHPRFPTTVLRPGQRWTSTTRWRFRTN